MITSGARLALMLADSIESWKLPTELVGQHQIPVGRKGNTGVAKAKRQADKRRNVRARSPK